jgi:ribosomal protein L30E
MTTKVVMGQLSTIVPKQSGSAKQIIYKARKKKKKKNKVKHYFKLRPKGRTLMCKTDTGKWT